MLSRFVGVLKIEDLKIKLKVEDMIKYAYSAIVQFPKSEKYALGTDIKRTMNRILELVITANKQEKHEKREREAALKALYIEVEKLKTYIRLSHNLNFLPIKKYEHWSKLAVEIGKMLGGWIKSQSTSAK